MNRVVLWHIARYGGTKSIWNRIVHKTNITQKEGKEEWDGLSCIAKFRGVNSLWDMTCSPRESDISRKRKCGTLRGLEPPGRISRRPHACCWLTYLLPSCAEVVGCGYGWAAWDQWMEVRSGRPLPDAMGNPHCRKPGDEAKESGRPDAGTLS